MPDDQSGKQMLGQYELRELLGQGGMGSVYRAWQASLKREVAIKVLPAHLVSSPGYIERFTREAETAASLEHAHIVPVYDYGTQQDATYIVMRLLTGGNLSERAQQHQLQGHETVPLVEIADVLKQIASALDYAHSRGVIHRDIKPGNIMFDNQGSVYLTDFGIARLMEATTKLTSTGATLGTPLYMSPEQWRGEGLTPASDQYSVAVMIYQLSTGHTPFEADTPYALMNKHIHEPPTPPQAYRSDIPESVTAVMNRALSKNPAERFPTVTAFAQSFSAAVAGLNEESTQFVLFKLKPASAAAPLPHSTSKAPIPPVPSTGKPFYRSPLVWIAAFAVLAITALAVLLISQDQRFAALASSASQTALAAIPTQTATSDVTIEGLSIIATETATETPSATPTFTATTALPTATPTPSSTLTSTPTLTFTHTPTSQPPTDTETPVPPTNTSLPTSTNTQAPPTATLIPTIEPFVAAQQTYENIQTSTAKMWTATPTIDITATFNAALTALFERDLTQTATHWTNTPLPVTPTLTPTPTLTASSTPILVPAPVAAFEVNPEISVAPASVQFVNQSTGDISAYNWNFGDGSTSSDENPSHTFATPGIFNVFLTVTGPGGSNSTVVPVVVNAPTRTPTATSIPLALSVITQNADWTPIRQTFDGIDMVLVPAGCFQLGSSAAGVDAAFAQCEADLGVGQCQHVWFEKETPQTQVCFDQPFWIAYSETTNGQYGGASGLFPNHASMPRDSVNWFDAAEFCAAHGMRLPSEAEWEYAARGPDNLIYPWGNEFISSNAAYEDNATQPEPIGSRPGGASWVGAVDMAGNLREWTSTIFASYPYNADDGRESLTNTVTDRVVRGGSFYVIPVSLRAADRVNVPPATEDRNIGFRCVRDFQPSDLPGDI